MMSWKFYVLPIVLTAVTAGIPVASCGLHFCPRGKAPARESWRLGLSLNRSGFDIGGKTGVFTEGVADVRYSYDEAWVFDLHVPLLSLDVGGERVFGFANPLALVEFRMHPGVRNMLGIGLQAELPWGDADAGLAQDHFMLMPYGSLSTFQGRIFLNGSAGASMAVAGSHDMEHDDMDHQAHTASHGAGTPLYVHPHEDFELTYRMSIGFALWNRKANPEVFLSGQHVLAETLEQGTSRDYLAMGATAPIDFGRYVIAPEVELPVSSDHRFEWTLGLATGFKF